MNSENTLDKWIEYYKSVGLNLNYVKRYNKYLSKLYNSNLPFIFEHNHLALLLGVQKDFLNKITYSPECFYRTFKIPKKNGGEREILAPFPSLLLIQDWIYKNILINNSIHKCAHGFTANKSIVSNCKIHAGQKEVLKIDLKDFFTTITFNRVIFHFNKIGYNKKISFYLAKLCTYKNYLPQGAPTSPILSNIIAVKMDKRLFSIAKKFKLNYTRYADDIVFSGNSIPIKFLEYVNNIIVGEGFQINTLKTKLYKETNKKIITGIVINKKDLKIPREYKRELVLNLNYILKYGLNSHIAKKKINDVFYLERIIGKVSFWLQVEPNNKYAKKSYDYLIEEFKRKTY